MFLLHGVILLVSILNWKSNPFKTASVTAAISTVSILFDPFVVTPKLFNMIGSSPNTPVAAFDMLLNNILSVSYTHLTLPTNSLV